MKGVNKNKRWVFKNNIFPLLILLSTLFIGIGYASINSISLDFEGEVIAKEVDGIYITEVNYVSDVDADLDKSKILNAYQTNLNSNIILSDSNKDSSITYEVFIHNSTNNVAYFDGVDYLLSDDTYSNDNIVFSISGMNINDSLLSGETKKVKITFYYKDNILSADNKLNSILNFMFTDFPCPKDGSVCDISGNNNHGSYFGESWDKENRILSFDGNDDYFYLENINFGNSTSFTIDFVAKIHKQDVTTPIILFETSVDSNNNYGAFYVDTNEFGNNEITLAMKYTTKEFYRINHKYVNEIIDNDEFRHYTITFNSNNTITTYTRIYYEGIYQTTTTHPPKDTINIRDYDGDITGEIVANYPFYIASRAGKKMFAKMDLKELRIYNRDLTDNEILKIHNGGLIKENLILNYDFR